MLTINGSRCHETGCPLTPAGRCDACLDTLTRLEVRKGEDGYTYCEDCAVINADTETLYAKA